MDRKSNCNGTAEPYSREGRAELLALAPSDRLVPLAERCLAGGDRLELIAEPRVGTVSLQVREPVRRERFLLGDVLAVTAEVELAGTRGWAMRLGDDRVAALAAAVCDAEAERAGGYAAEVEELCRDTEERSDDESRREWQELAPTIVQFEELV